MALSSQGELFFLKLVIRRKGEVVRYDPERFKDGLKKISQITGKSLRKIIWAEMEGRCM